MKSQPIEEVHLLSLFEHLEQAIDFGELIDASLIKYKNDPSLFGDQLVVDVMGNIIDRVEHMLYGPSKLSFETLIHEILRHDGLAIPAHIDRPSNSVLANLGFLPELPYSALEMMRPPLLPSDSNYTIIQAQMLIIFPTLLEDLVISKLKVLLLMELKRHY